MIKLSDHCFH